MTYRTTDRDLALLYALWSRGKLSRIAITDLFFNNNRTYAYRRLQMLKERDWIQSHIGRVDGQSCAIYELQDGGIKQLLNAGKVTLASIEQHKEVARPIRKRKRSRKWTERDIALLHELYKLREMSKTQCLALFFPNNEVYGKKRIEVMRQARIILSITRYAKELGRLQATLRITERGLHMLVERGLVQEREVRARDLELSDKQRSYILDANEISFKVKHVPYLDSRAIKRKYNLNRGDLVLGSLSPSEGDYMLYILTAGVYGSTVKRIVDEISVHLKKRAVDGVSADINGIAGYLIYYRDEEARDTFERYSVGLVTGGVPIHLLPYSDRGIFVTRELIFGEVEAVLHLMERTIGQEAAIRYLPSSKYHFDYGVTYKDGSSKYIINSLTGNKIKLERIMREYKGSTAKGRMDALLFCWTEDEVYYRTKAREAHWIEIVPIMPPSFETRLDSN